MASLSSICTSKSLSASVSYGTTRPTPECFSSFNPWTVRLRYQGRTMTVPFFTGPAITREPTAADVLSCLLSDAVSVDSTQGFEDWCSNLGFDSDSRTDECTYRACQSISKRLHKFLGEDFETFTRAEH